MLKKSCFTDLHTECIHGYMLSCIWGKLRGVKLKSVFWVCSSKSNNIFPNVVLGKSQQLKQSLYWLAGCCAPWASQSHCTGNFLCSQKPRAAAEVAAPYLCDTHIPANTAICKICLVTCSKAFPCLELGFFSPLRNTGLDFSHTLWELQFLGKGFLLGFVCTWACSGELLESVRRESITL